MPAHMNEPVLNESPYIYVHRAGLLGGIHNEIKHLPSEIIDLSDFRSRREALPPAEELELAEQDFSFLLMAQDILGEQKDLPEDFIAPLNKVMSKVGKKTSSKPRF